MHNHGQNPRVFGSVLSETDTEESDLDILIEPLPGMTLFNVGAIRYELKELLKIKVDVLTPVRIAGSLERCGSAGSKADLIRLYSYQYKLTSSSSSSLKTRNYVATAQAKQPTSELLAFCYKSVAPNSLIFVSNTLRASMFSSI